MMSLRAVKTQAFAHVDWVLFFTVLAISLFGLATMHSFSVENSYFDKQAIWICIAVGVFFVACLPEYGFLKRTPILAALFVFIVALLTLIFAFGSIVRGAQNRFSLGAFAVQPADPAKLILVMVLAKYFARRHVEIANLKHILISGAYAFVLFALVFLQPDFGSAFIIFSIWLGMVLVAGISWRHVATLFIIAALASTILWNFGLQGYQKDRIMTFIHPLADVQDTGYNAYQSTVAVGSGQLLGKGIGYGTQSKLQFLPEFQTDFIFAAYAEEWGFVGILILFGLYALLISRILAASVRGASNFEMLYAAGLAIYFIAQFLVHAGMDLGLFPIVGMTLPFMSYGGSHLVTEYLGLGILMGMRRHSRVPQARDETEIVGVV